MRRVEIVPAGILAEHSVDSPLHRPVRRLQVRLRGEVRRQTHLLANLVQRLAVVDALDGLVVYVADGARIVAERLVDGLPSCEWPAVRSHQVGRMQLPHAIERGGPLNYRTVRLAWAGQHRKAPIEQVAGKQRFEIGEPHHQVIHGFAQRVIQLEAHAAFGELILLVERDLRRDITAFARTQQVDTQRGAALFPRHTGGPLHLVQLAVVARHQAILAHLLDVVLLRDHLRIRPREDLRAIDVIAMKVGIDDVADGQRGDLAEIVEGCLGGRLAFGGIDHHYAAVRQYEDDIAQRVAGGAIDVRIDADEFGRVLRELGGGGQAGEKQQDGREGSHLAPYKSG